MARFHPPTLFAELPWWIRWSLIGGGTLVTAFSNRLPETWQDVGLYFGIVILGYGVLATGWHHILQWHKRQTAARKMGMASWYFIAACLLTAVCAVAAAGYGLGLRASTKDASTRHDLQNVFDVDQVVPASLSNTDNEWIQVTATLRFEAPFQDGEIALFGYPNVDLKTKPPSFLVYRLPQSTFLAGESLDIPIATVFVADNNNRPANDFWGNGKTSLNGLSKHEFVGATENIAEIQLTSGGKVAQSFKIFFATFVPGTGGRGRVFILPEDRDVFEK
jgi:hypothetical protein